jgi:hypothetical protein
MESSNLLESQVAKPKAEISCLVESSKTGVPRVQAWWRMDQGTNSRL